MEKKIKKIVYGLDELNDIGVYAISLVNMPAIEANFVALSSHVLLKEDKKRNMVYGPVLIPNKEILRVSDKGEEYLIEFPAETIQKAQEMFMKNGYQNEATYEHAVKINGVTVVESWIKESENDKSVHLGFDYPIGTWFVGQKVDNVELREKIMSGEVKGFSIEGYFSERESAALSSDHAILSEIAKLVRCDQRWRKIGNSVFLKKTNNDLSKTIAWLKEFGVNGVEKNGQVDFKCEPKKFTEIVKAAKANQLIDLGFRVWETTNNMNEEEGTKLPADMVIMNYPQKFYSLIENGTEVIGLFGESYKFEAEKSDDDERFGVLPYGILKNEKDWKH